MSIEKDNPATRFVDNVNGSAKGAAQLILHADAQELPCPIRVDEGPRYWAEAEKISCNIWLSTQRGRAPRKLL